MNAAKRVGFVNDYNSSLYLGGAALVNAYISKSIAGPDLEVVELLVNETRDDWQRIESEKWDLLIIANIPYVSAERLVSLVQSPVPYILVRHDIVGFAYTESPATHAMAGLLGVLFSRAVVSVFVSPIQLAYYERICAIERKLVLPPPIDLSAFENLQRPDRSGFLYLGPINPARGIDLAIDYVKSNFPSVPISFYGQDESEELMELIVREGHSVSGLVSRNEVPALMNRYSDFIYFPKIIDAFSIKMLEAELCGLRIHALHKNIGRYYFDIPSETLRDYMRNEVPAILRNLVRTSLGLL
jgi:glycosyltransferase involved in cell wall biosynthesis